MKIFLYNNNNEIDYESFMTEIKDYLSTFGYEEYTFYSIFPIEELGVKEAAVSSFEEALKKFNLIFSFSDNFFGVGRDNPITSGIIKVEKKDDYIVFNDFHFEESISFLNAYDILNKMQSDLEKYERDDFDIDYRIVENLRYAINILKKYINEPN